VIPEAWFRVVELRLREGRDRFPRSVYDLSIVVGPASGPARHAPRTVTGSGLVLAGRDGNLHGRGTEELRGLSIPARRRRSCQLAWCDQGRVRMVSGIGARDGGRDLR